MSGQGEKGVVKWGAADGKHVVAVLCVCVCGCAMEESVVEGDAWAVGT